MADVDFDMVAIGELKLDPLNPRQMPDTEMAALRRSISEFGFVEPVVVRKSDWQVIGGHQRIEAARQLGLQLVPVVWWEGSDEAARALNLALNRIHGEWDQPKLAAELATLADVDSLAEALQGFDQTWTELAGFDVSDVLEALNGHFADEAAREDLAALAGELGRPSGGSSRTGQGDGYVLGVHRVLCGDARDPATVRALCGDAVPAVLFTDPPYNVAYDPNASPSGRSRARGERRLGAIAEDDLDGEEHGELITQSLQNAAAVLAPGACVYVCGGTSTTTTYDAAFQAADIAKSSMIVWDKSGLCQDSGLDPDFSPLRGEKLPHLESESSRREDQVGALLDPEP